MLVRGHKVRYTAVVKVGEKHEWLTTWEVSDGHSGDCGDGGGSGWTIQKKREREREGESNAEFKVESCRI